MSAEEKKRPSRRRVADDALLLVAMARGFSGAGRDGDDAENVTRTTSAPDEMFHDVPPRASASRGNDPRGRGDATFLGVADAVPPTSTPCPPSFATWRR